jgi:hypothetical protein
MILSILLSFSFVSAQGKVQDTVKVSLEKQVDSFFLETWVDSETGSPYVLSNGPVDRDTFFKARNLAEKVTLINFVLLGHSREDLQKILDKKLGKEE